jgi:hypothetical protein
MQSALTTDVAFLIDSTIQQSMATNGAATEKINYYKLLGGGKEPLEEWETYEIEVKQLEASDERVTKAQHSRLLTDATGRPTRSSTSGRRTQILKTLQ